MEDNNCYLCKNKKHPIDVLLQTLVYLSAGFTIFILACLMIYILSNGLPYVSWKFISSTFSENNENLKGILPMIINTLYIVIITLLISIPIGIATSIYLTQYTTQNLIVKLIRFTTEILAGVPSIIFGLFGYSVFCGIMKLGTSILAGCLTMSICVLPTIIRTSEEALISVSNNYKEGAFALGASKIRVIGNIVLPCSISGIITAIILAVGRIVGESAALLYTCGTSYNMPKNIFSHITSSGRTLTLHLYQFSKQASTENAFHIAFATAAVLLILTLIFNIAANCLSNIFKPK